MSTITTNVSIRKKQPFRLNCYSDRSGFHISRIHLSVITHALVVRKPLFAYRKRQRIFFRIRTHGPSCVIPLFFVLTPIHVCNDKINCTEGWIQGRGSRSGWSTLTIIIRDFSTFWTYPPRFKYKYLSILKSIKKNFNYFKRSKRYKITLPLILRRTDPGSAPDLPFFSDGPLL